MFLTVFHLFYSLLNCCKISGYCYGFINFAFLLVEFTIQLVKSVIDIFYISKVFIVRLFKA